MFFSSSLHLFLGPGVKVKAKVTPIAHHYRVSRKIPFLIEFLESKSIWYFRTSYDQLDHLFGPQGT